METFGWLWNKGTRLLGIVLHLPTTLRDLDDLAQLKHNYKTDQLTIQSLKARNETLATNLDEQQKANKSLMERLNAAHEAYKEVEARAKQWMPIETGVVDPIGVEILVCLDRAGGSDIAEDYIITEINHPRSAVELYLSDLTTRNLIRRHSNVFDHVKTRYSLHDGGRKYLLNNNLLGD